MRKVVTALIFAWFMAICASAQVRPFEDFRKAVRAEPGGFAGNKGNLSKIFNDERVRLGRRFETELWEYLENDPDKHFWIASFIDSKSYLHGNTPLPQLAFKIRKRTLDLLGNDKRSRGRRVATLHELAIASKLTGDQEQALRFRDEAEDLAKDPDLSPYIAGRTRYDICIYENLAGSISSCDENEGRVEKIISAGWLNSRAVELPLLVYPANLQGRQRVKAQVDVRVLLGTDGDVLSADVIRGPTEFHNAAVEAAKKTRFAPTYLSGQATKVSGWMSFVFKP